MPNLTPKGSFVGRSHITSIHPFPGATGAYQAADVVGTLMTFPDVVRAKSSGTVLMDIVVIDRDDQKAALDLVLLHTSIPSSDIPDNGASAIVDSDVDYIIGTVSIPPGKYVDVGGASVATVTTVLPIVGSGSTRSIYGYLISRGTPTYTTDGLTVKLGLLDD